MRKLPIKGNHHPTAINKLVISIKFNGINMQMKADAGSLIYIKYANEEGGGKFSGLPD